MAKKGTTTTTSPLTWDQFNTLISKMAFEIEHHITHPSKQVQQSKFLLLVAVGCYTGMRIGDILSLRWWDMLDKEYFDLVEQKRKKRRKVTINHNLQALMKKYVSIIKPVTYNDLIFTNVAGGTFSIQYVNRKLKELFKVHGIKVKQPSSHTLRKTFGRRVFETNYKSDEALIVLSQVFNHANTQITRRYIGLESETIKNVYLSI